MHLLRDLHPTLLSALEGIVDQVREGVVHLAVQPKLMITVDLSLCRSLHESVKDSNHTLCRLPCGQYSPSLPGLIPMPDDLVP